MSSEVKEYTIKSTGDKFTVSTEGKPGHTGSISRQGGADVVQFGAPETPFEQMKMPRPSEVLNAAGGMIEMRGDGSVHAIRPETFTPTRGGNPVNPLSEITDLAGRVERDLSKVRQNPEAYKARIGGTEATVASLMQAGILSIDGSGNFEHDLAGQMALTNPNDPSNPRNQKPAVDPDIIEYGGTDYKAFEHIARTTGVSPTEWLAKAIGGKNVGRELASMLGQGIDPDRMQTTLEGLVGKRLDDAADLINRELGTNEGYAILDHATNKLSRQKSQQIIYGILSGSKAAFREAVKSYAAKDRN
jgi:hypothetical protein